MKPDDVIFQIATLSVDAEDQIDRIKRMKTNQDHKAILTAKARERIEALNITLRILKNSDEQVFQ